MDQTELSHALGFSSEELTANRDGYMTKAQRRALRNAGRETAAFLGLGCGIGLVVLIFLIDTMVLQPKRSDPSLDGIVITAFPIGMLTGILAARNIYGRFKADLYKGKVEYIGGRIHLFRQGRSWQYSTYRLVIRNQVFQISKQDFEAFSDDEYYGIYFVPHSNALLSAEKLGQP